jgi:hypothetical protein
LTLAGVVLSASLTLISKHFGAHQLRNLRRSKYSTRCTPDANPAAGFLPAGEQILPSNIELY